MEILPYLTGPAAAVVLMAAILYGLYRLVDTRVIPAAERFVDRHLAQVDRIVASHDEDRKVWSQGLAAIAKVEGDVAVIRTEVHGIREDLDEALAAQATRQAERRTG